MDGWLGERGRVSVALLGAALIHGGVLLALPLTSLEIARPQRIGEVAIQLASQAPLPAPAPRVPESVHARTPPDRTFLPPAPLTEQAGTRPGSAVEPVGSRGSASSASSPAGDQQASTDGSAGSPRDGVRSAAVAARGPIPAARSVSSSPSSEDAARSAAATALARLGSRATPDHTGTESAGISEPAPDAAASIGANAVGAPDDGDSAGAVRAESVSGSPTRGDDGGASTGLAASVDAALASLAAVSAAAGSADGASAVETEVPQANMQVGGRDGTEVSEAGGGVIAWDDATVGRIPLTTAAPQIPDTSSVRGGCTVRVTFTLEASGLVSSPRTVEGSGDTALDAAVLEAVRTWRFTAAPGAAPGNGRVTFECEQS